MKFISSVIVLLCCSALINATAVVNQLTNALIANTNLGAVLTDEGFGSLGFAAAASCSANTSYPAAGSISSLKICYATTLAYPYRNATAGTGATGYEVSVTNSWGSLLSAQYGSSFSLTFVPLPVDADGLFATLQRALAAGTCDTGLTSLFQNAARDALLQSSCSYGSTYSAYLVGPKEVSTPITSDLASLNRTEVVIAVGRGTNALAFLQANNMQSTLVLTVGTTESIAFVVNQTAHVAIGDAPVLSYYAASTNPTLCGATTCPVYQLSPSSQLVAYTTFDSSSTTGTVTTASATGTATGSATASTTSRPSTSSASFISGSILCAVVAAVALM